MTVLDASGVLALMHDEAGSDVVVANIVGADIDVARVRELLAAAGVSVELGMPTMGAPGAPEQPRDGVRWLMPPREPTMATGSEFDSYYGRPILKEPVWHVPDLPGYLFLGGMAGAVDRPRGGPVRNAHRSHGRDGVTTGHAS